MLATNLFTGPFPQLLYAPSDVSTNTANIHLLLTLCLTYLYPQQCTNEGLTK